jgi:hypothetical protein
MKQVFLSAGIPSKTELPWGATADPMLIHSAVRSLCALVFGHKRIVWGGQPAITPMMWAACENLGIDYAKTVHLYQSRFFADAFPEENALFNNVTFVDAGPDRASSLSSMRKEMFKNEFEAGVFIGGKDGILDEFDLFRAANPKAGVVVLTSTGGAAKELGEKYPELSAPGGDFIDYLSYMAGFIDVTGPKRKPKPKQAPKRTRRSK